MAVGRLQGEVSGLFKRELPKPYLARLSFGLGVIGLIMGSMLACYCWGWFVCSGAFFVYPILNGSRPLKIFAICLVIISMVSAIVEFLAEWKIEAKTNAERIRNSAPASYPMPGLLDIPDDAKVLLKLHFDEVEIELPEQLRKQFITMLRKEAVYVDFMRATALPYAKFEVDGKVFGWYGNSVVEGETRKGRVWSSPLMQALINNSPSSTASGEVWGKYLGELNADTNIQATVVQGLGAYPDRNSGK
ncbi:MAG: hypothetical protein K0Q55_2685 [Verrucomicrobia bacterium]|jgi:hypothetical protein|nr:hypothetical protein [Verrucomicrobiota bacterium]